MSPQDTTSTAGARGLYTIVRGRPRLSGSVSAARSGSRRVGELADVTASAARPAQRIQYWTFSDVTAARDRDLVEGSLVHDLTFLRPEPIGWESSKTHGHVHPDEPGYAEVYEVLEGRGGVLIQDLLPGPIVSFVVLVEAEPGDCVVIPPLAHHATVNLGTDMLVFSDVVAREARDEYLAIRATHGMAYYIDQDGSGRPNPRYASVPPITRMRASVWSDLQGPLYRRMVTKPHSLEWLLDPGDLERHFPLVASYGRRISEAADRLPDV